MRLKKCYFAKSDRNVFKQIVTKSIGKILVCEPNLESHNDFELRHYQQVIEKADIVLFLLDHKEFKNIKAVDLKKIPHTYPRDNSITTRLHHTRLCF